MHPKGAKRNIVDHAIFSNEGPNLNSPEETKIPRVIPNIYKLRNNKNKLSPKSKSEIPKSGDVNNIAGTRPIRDLINAVNTNEIKISLFLRGVMKRFVKFLLQISSRNNMLNPILVLNKKS